MSYWNGCTDGQSTLSGNGLYPKALENFMSGTMNFFDLVSTNQLVIALVDSSSSITGNGYQPCANHVYWSDAINEDDVAAPIQSMPDAEITGSFHRDCWPCGMYLSSSATVFSAVNASTNAGNIGNIVLSVDGTPGESDYLIGYFTQDKNYDTIDITPDGDNITINWDFDQNNFLGAIFKLISL